jgi:hypothetical protein
MFKSILLPIDLASEASWKKPLELAVELARDRGGVLHVISVLPDFGMSVVGSYFDKDFEGAALMDMTGQLKAWVSRNVPKGVKAEPHVAHGSIYDEIMWRMVRSMTKSCGWPTSWAAMPSSWPRTGRNCATICWGRTPPGWCAMPTSRCWW